ncbi:UPF0187-domain-containing protein [Serendipita vermifera]|nr:UPF0187-domain-containing protein [Serendipita vermifera]
MLTVLGTILGLVVSFRTSSAYDRYWEGRKLWSTIALSSRQLAQIIWIHVPNERKQDPSQPPLTEEEMRVRSIVEKRSMINLVQAYSVSMKHFLRGESGIYYADLYPLISFLPQFVDHPPENGDVKAGVGSSQLPLFYQSAPPKPFKAVKRAKTFDPEQVLPQVTSEFPLRPARNPPRSSIWDFLPFLLPFRWAAKLVSRKVREAIQEAGDERTISGKVRKPAKVESNVPLEVTLFLSSYLAYLLKQGLLQAALATAYANQLQSIQDCMAALQRIRNTPLPFAYQVHLRMSIWLYLLVLPFEIYSSFKWLTIPMTTFASFLILGFLEIGQEIENPFSYEANDLDLDGFCLEIQREMHEITTHVNPNPHDFIFTQTNQPLAPTERMSAAELIRQGPYLGPDGKAYMRRTLLQNWQMVNEQTRDPSQN